MVKRVLAKQPHHLEAMGLLAATEALQLHDDQHQADLLRARSTASRIRNAATAYLLRRRRAAGRDAAVSAGGSDV